MLARTWRWLRGAGVWIASALAVVLGAAWLWRRQRARLGAVRDELAVAEATRELLALKAQRQEVVAQLDEQDDAVVLLNGKIEEQKRRIAAAHEGGASMTDREVDDELRRLGIL